ncbi:MAG: metallophosphoesterase [Candidatus Krumholzibacteriia bacterium]
MATLIIGDIHGCWAELQALLDKVGPGERDLILAVGDLVNRGPDSPRVLDFFRQTPNAASIRGNHEERHLEARRGNVPLGFAHEVARLQWSAADYQEAVTAMGRLRRRRELREATVVHAYWEAGVPAAKQRPEILTGLPGGLERIWEQHARPWYELYDGPKPLVVGHLDYLQNGQPFVYADRVWCLDTGCVRGGRLTGLTLPDFALHSVPAGKRYWQAQRKDFADLRAYDPDAQADLTWTELDTLLEDIDGRHDLPPGLAERRERLHRFRRRAEASLDILLEVLGKRSRVMAKILKTQPGFAELNGKEQRRRFRERAGQGLEGRLLLLAYRGRLGRRALRKRFPRPRDLLAACMTLGVPLADAEKSK